MPSANEYPTSLGPGKYQDKTLNTRETQYGTYDTNAKLAQTIKAVFRESKKWNVLTFTQKESLELIATKISRILNGNQNNPDSWRDIAGYAGLVEHQLNAEKGNGENA